MRRAITISFNDRDEIEGIEIQAPSEETQKILEATARRIMKVLRPPLKVRLARLVLPWAERWTEGKWTRRRSLWLDWLITWAGK